LIKRTFDRQLNNPLQIIHHDKQNLVQLFCIISAGQPYDIVRTMLSMNEFETTQHDVSRQDAIFVMTQYYTLMKKFAASIFWILDDHNNEQDKS
jgi:hypothetical protein